MLNIEPASLQWLKPIQFIIENLESHEAYYKNMRHLVLNISNNKIIQKLANLVKYKDTKRKRGIKCSLKQQNSL